MFEKQPISNFETASRGVLQFLHRKLGFNLWMVTRTEGEDWIVLQSEDHGYKVENGAVFQWADSFCSQMVLRNGPNIAPSADAVPAYANAPIREKIQIGAYIGMPLMRNDRSVFGTLCAIHPESMPDSMKDELPLVQLLSEMLGAILIAELNSVTEYRRAERATAEAVVDPLTQLYNRRGWDHLLDKEESRCKRYGNPACVISIDLDNLKTVNDTLGHAAGDELIRRAAQAIRCGIREQDIAARLGGDEFAVLGVECDLGKSKVLVERLNAMLDERKVSASIGFSLRSPRSGLQQTLQDADQVMYACKRLKQQSRAG